MVFVGLVAAAPTVFGHAMLGLFFSSRAGEHSAWSAPKRIDASLPLGDDDKPVALVDAGAQSPNKGRLYVAWTRTASASPGRKILVSHTDDHGATWSAPEPVGPVDSWGARLAVDQAGGLYVSAWSGQALWLARSTDGSATFGPPRTFRSLSGFYSNGVETIPAEPAEPVHPDAALAVDTSPGGGGNVYAAASLPSTAGRRVAVTAFRSDLTVATRTTIRIRTRGAYDEFNPAVAVDPSTGIVWACFYATGTGKRRVLATYSCVTSADHGQHWSKVIGGAAVPSNETQPGTFSRTLSSNYASYDGLAVAQGVAHPIWTDTRRLGSLKEEIYTTRLSR